MIKHIAKARAIEYNEKRYTGILRENAGKIIRQKRMRGPQRRRNTGKGFRIL